jgi:hypothetical protein
MNGVGTQKLKQFGEKFIAAICKYAEVHALPPRPTGTPQEGNEMRRSMVDGASTRGARGGGSTYEATKRLVLEKMSVEEIAHERGLATATIIAHIEKLATDPRLDISYLRPTGERFERIIATFAQTDGFALFPVRTILGEEYSYDEIRWARMFLGR